jgi:hypothetical protein
VHAFQIHGSPVLGGDSDGGIGGLGLQLCFGTLGQDPLGREEEPLAAFTQEFEHHRTVFADGLVGDFRQGIQGDDLGVAHMPSPWT